jgi:hypothetical protein
MLKRVYCVQIERVETMLQIAKSGDDHELQEKQE